MTSDFSGHRSGRWTVLREVAARGKNRYFLCRCECGTEREISYGGAIVGQSRSCGCLREELKRGRAPVNKTHGMSSSREFQTWARMKGRCYNRRNPDYPDYGGRGIRVCDRWLESFEAFYADMGPRPAGHSIDRKNSNGNYEPDNCHWTTAVPQASNRRSNQTIAFRGETHTVQEWSRRTGLKAASIYWRLHRGWTPERTLTTVDSRRKP